MADELHTCPRRAETGRDNPDSPFHDSGTNLDVWRADAAGPCCSYCGSLQPDRFLELVRAGWTVGPTDKSYKAYLSRPATAEEMADRKAKWLAGMTHDGVDDNARERGETPEEFRAALADHYDREIARTEAFGTQAKVYFQHLSVEQQDDFIGLHNAKLIKFGYPGGFYVTPFFAQRRPTETGGE